LNNELTNFINNANSLKSLYTAGPSSLLEASINSIQPCFGRNDDLYDQAEEYVLEYLKKLSSHKNIIRLQGSATLAIEIGLANFCKGRILIINTGYYSERMLNIIKKYKVNDLENIINIDYNEIENIKGQQFDWFICCYTETSIGFKVDINKIKEIASQSGAQLFLDGTASIGLENNHNLADVLCYSSCKGLFGLTGGAFIAFNNQSWEENQYPYYLSIDTHINKGVTGPYHTILSLYGILQEYDLYRNRVIKWRDHFLEVFSQNIIYKRENQPALCTLLDCELKYLQENPIIYSPRSKNKGSLVCHIGQVHRNIENINHSIIRSHFEIKNL
tara:strand:+ start:948 stop:1943 length:996 start_codon:yes stop_codon:yes gene_type:complete